MLHRRVTYLNVGLTGQLNNVGDSGRVISKILTHEIFWLGILMKDDDRQSDDRLESYSITNSSPFTMTDE